jgi:hypothetical protein
MADRLVDEDAYRFNSSPSRSVPDAVTECSELVLESCHPEWAPALTIINPRQAP